MAKHAHLAIDLGAESGRGVVGLLDGVELELHEVHRFPNRSHRLPSGLHWDVSGLWEGGLEATRRALELARRRQAPLVSLGVDTWGVDYGLLDGSGELIGLPRCYRDERHEPAFAATLAELGEQALYEATGIQMLPFNTLFQLVAHREAQPEVLDAAERLLFMPDLMHYFFTGEPVVEASIASTSQMLDPRTGDWAWSLLEQVGVPRRILGPISAPPAPLGHLLPHVADAVGADGGTLVIAPAAHDTASAVAAIPAEADERWCFISSGTWSLMGAETDQPCMTEAARTAGFTNERGVGGTTRLLRNLTGLWLVQECRRQFEREGSRVDYETLTDLAVSADPLRTLVDVNDRCFLMPGRMPERITEYARSSGQPEPREAGSLIRCCLESLALAYRHTLGQLERILDRPFDVIRLVGGGGRNTLLNQMTADATGRRVIVGPDEATATGNLLVQAMGAGHVRDRHDLRRIVAEATRTQAYDPQEGAPWDAAYDRFLELLHADPAGREGGGHR